MFADFVVDTRSGNNRCREATGVKQQSKESNGGLQPVKLANVEKVPFELLATSSS